MNKSKFLKRSLAALLAILMVAAMIPLSAAAATEVIGNGETITVSPGTLAKGDDEYNWTVTLPYDNADGTTTITLATDRQNVEFFTVAEDGTETTVATGHSAQVPVTGVTVSTPVTKTIVLRTIASDPAEVDALATYTVTVQKEATSTDTTVSAAVATISTVEYKGVVEGNTITFANLPWGTMHSDADSAIPATIKATLTNPRTDAVNDALAIADIRAEKNSITVTGQNGNTAVYNVVFKESTSFTGITLGGVAAEQDTTDPKKWTVTIDPEDAAAGTGRSIKLKVSAPKRVADIGQGATYAAATAALSANNNAGGTAHVPVGDTFVISLASTPIADDQVIYIKARDNKGNDAACQLTVKLAKNSDTGIKSFSVFDGTYNEPGNVSTMTVTMKNGTDDISLAKTSATATFGCLQVNFEGDIKGVTLNNVALTNDLTATGSEAAKAKTYGNYKYDSSGPTYTYGEPLKVGNNTLVVTAEDGTQKTYNLIVKADSNKTTNPQITGATITLGDDEEEISAKTVDQTNHKIVFEIPASLADEVDSDAVSGIQWKTSVHTTADTFVKYAMGTNDAAVAKLYTDAAGKTDEYTSYLTPNAPVYSANGADEYQPADFKHTITATSDGPGTQKYMVYFVAANPNQSTRLTSIKFYDAESESEVTADNTYEARGNDANYTATLNKTLPYSLYNPGTDNLAVAYEIPARAKVYYTKDVSGTEKMYLFGTSGFDKKGRPQTTITGADLAAIEKIVVVNELAFTVASTNLGTVDEDTGVAYVSTSGGALENLTETTHYKAYEFKKTKADASTLNQLVSLKSANGEVSAVINGYSVNLIVPPTYVVKNSETEFDLVAEVSENASLYKNAYKDDLGAVIAANKSDLDDPITFENVKVVENADGTYSLTQSGSISAFVVVAQDGTTLANYTLTVTVAELDDNADISGITADGVAATEGEDGAWTVELPYGTDLEAVEVAATAASSKATTAVTKNEDGTYTITVTAERGNIKTYTLTVTVGEEPAAPEFDDVPTWAQEAVGKAAEMGWMVGIGNSKFGPNGNIRRGDFALTIARILEDDWANVSADYAKDVFTDVKAGDWYYEAVAYIAEKGIMNGRANGFDPRTGITREEAAKVICLAKGLEPLEGNTTFTDDASIAGWAKPYVKACQEAGIMNGSSNSVNPKQQLTRAEAAQLFVNAFIDAEPAE